MARLPDSEILRLKQDIKLSTLCPRYGIGLKKHGSSDLIGLCPFHDDKDPSFVVTPSKNLWHCLGACQQGGSVIDFVMKAESISFRHACDLLRDRPLDLGGKIKQRSARASVPKLDNPLAAEGGDHELMTSVVDYYHRTLKDSPEAMGYLKSRGLNSSELIERYRLGFANRTLGFRLPGKNRQSGKQIRQRLQALGVLRISGHEHFNGSIVVPIFDKHGHCVEIYGRKIRNDLRKGTPLHLYLSGPHRGVWNIDAFTASDEIILCESLIDAMTFWCNGYRNVTACYGTEGFIKDHLTALKQHDIKRVLIAFDRDTAGENAAWKVARQLNTHHIETHQVNFPRGMDANEYALKVTPPDKSLGVALRQAIWLGKGTARTEEDTEGPADPEGAESQKKPEAICPDDIDTEIDTKNSPDNIDDRACASYSLAAIAANEKTPTQPAEPTAGELSPTPDPQPTAAASTDDNGGGREIRFTYGERCYRIRGLEKNTSFETLKINLLASRGESLHVDTLDLYSARQRTTFINQGADELSVKQDVIKKDLGRVLLELEQKQEEMIRQAMAPKKTEIKINDDDRRAALELLQSPDLLQRILVDFDRCGIVGEQTNKLTGYLAAVSRKLDQPLAVIVQSSSAAGKSSLMEAILAFMPQEQQVKYSAMTGQSLFYMGQTDIKHKILAIVEEEGAEKASYALKLLQSEGELTIASTGKDSATGRLTTEEYHVEGPVMIFLTTTAAEIDEELLNRCMILTVDEDRNQTRAIHQRQRQAQTLEGLLARRDSEAVLTVHRNAQRLLRTLLVANPYAKELTFLNDRTRTRRDHMKYLTLIRTVTLLHQYQRPVKQATHNGRQVEYIEATVDDIATANRLAHEVLGRSLDELAPQTRRLLCMLDEMVAEVCQKEKIERRRFQFTQRDVREFTTWTDYQVKTHLRKLVELEYVLALRGGRGQSFVYELLYEGQGKNGRPFVMQLIDIDKLRGKYNYDEEHDKHDKNDKNDTEKVRYDPKWEHQKAKREGSGSSRGAAGEHTGSIGKNEDISGNDSGLSTLAAEDAEKPLLGSEEKPQPVMS